MDVIALFASLIAIMVSAYTLWITHLRPFKVKYEIGGPFLAMVQDKAPSIAMVKEFERRRDLIHQRLNEINGISAVKPKGAFYIFANVTEACEKLGLKNSIEFQEYLLEKADVVVLSKSNQDFYRIKTNPAVGTNDSDTKNHEIIFKVQVLSSGTRLSTNSQRFKGLRNVWEYKDGGLYKYTAGDKKDLKSACVLQSELQKKGFTDAFVVVFQDGKRIPVKEALKLLKLTF